MATPRKPRFFIVNAPVHITQRAHSRNPVFFDAEDDANYAHWLGESAKVYGIAIYAFVP